jgi:hypothetical protein
MNQKVCRLKSSVIDAKQVGNADKVQKKRVYLERVVGLTFWMTKRSTID